MFVASFRYESRSFDVSLLPQAVGVFGEQRRHHAAGDQAHVLEEGVQGRKRAVPTMLQNGVATTAAIAVSTPIAPAPSHTK